MCEFVCSRWKATFTHLHTNSQVVPSSLKHTTHLTNINRASLPQANIIFKTRISPCSLTRSDTHIHSQCLSKECHETPTNSSQSLPITKVQRCVISDNVYLHREIPTVILYLQAPASLSVSIDVYTVIFQAISAL